MRPRVRECSLAHADSRDDKHRDLATDGQLADRDRLVGEGHLYISSSVADPDPDHDRGVGGRHSAVVAVVDGVGRPNELDRPVRGGHMYPGADDCPLGRVHRRGVGHLDD